MKVGMLTAPFGGEPLANAVNFAAEASFDCLEIATGPKSSHCDVTTGDMEAARKVAKLVKDAGLEISSFAYYTNVFGDGPSVREDVVTAYKNVVDTASELGVGVVCALAGLPVSGIHKHPMIREWAPKAWGPLAEYAAGKSIKIAFENWFATLLQSPAEFAMLFESVPHAALGLNYDPSHLVHQGCDWLATVDEFASRIFHTHAKDTEIRQSVLRRVGNQNGGWWRYVIPGFGLIDWGVYVATLRRNGINNVLSIEHEDGSVGREEGFVKGLRYLRQFA